jgi:putative ABC transport system ATP-binding protein
MSLSAGLRVRNVMLLLGAGEQQVRALDDVTIDVNAGQLLAVLGPSGAGKSSLLAVCGGLCTPTSGQVFIGDTEITTLDRARLAEVRRDRVGFVFQQSNLLPSLTAVDQLLLLAHMAGRRPGRRERDKAMGLLREVGMEQKANRLPGQMSGGERQRVGIARALMNDPQILLVDEPTSMLDHHRGRQIVELLARQCHQHQVAALMVTHDHAMRSLADCAVHILDGRLSPDGHEHAAN